MKRTSGIATLMALLTLPIAAAAQHAPVDVPLRVQDGRLVVTVQAANGTALDFLLSTGNAVTVFSISGEARAGGAALTIGGYPVNTEGSVTIDDERLDVGGQTLDGIVAGNTLNQFDVLIDAPAGRLVLKPFGRAVEWPGVALSEPVRLRIYHGIVLALDGRLDGVDYGAMLDTGAKTVVVNSAVQTALGLEVEDAATLQIGSRSFTDLPVRVEDMDVLQRFDPNGNGFMIVGGSIAVDCAIAISWIHREMRTCVR